MTRFARAKGSKASNERREEDATPWHVMRQQLLNQPGNNNLESNENLSQIVKNIKSRQLESGNEIWSDFGEVKHTSVKKKKANIFEKKESKTEVKKLKLSSSITRLDQNKIKKDSQKNKLSREKVKVFEKSKDTSLKFNVRKENTVIDTDKKKHVTNKKNQNKNGNKKNIEKETFSNTSNLEQVNHTVPVVYTSNEDELNKKSELKGSNMKYGHSNERWNNCNNSYTIVANGREIKIVRFEGFLIKKDDAEQLKILRKKLRSENIPKDKIKAIMKLERRRAEKTLSREKNTVCFHCRKFGHNFADCPDIKESEVSNSGICFKCGSTEHTHFECKVSQNQNFRYAVCFVCKEQGHIARQCALNPQGQYPKGGSCHKCGEVTHLRKDCPKVDDEKPNKTLTVERLNGPLEDIDEVQSSTKKSENRRNKVVIF